MGRGRPRATYRGPEVTDEQRASAAKLLREYDRKAKAAREFLTDRVQPYEAFAFRERILAKQLVDKMVAEYSERESARNIAGTKEFDPELGKMLSELLNKLEEGAGRWDDHYWRTKFENEYGEEIPDGAVLMDRKGEIVSWMGEHSGVCNWERDAKDSRGRYMDKMAELCFLEEDRRKALLYCWLWAKRNRKQYLHNGDEWDIIRAQLPKEHYTDYGATLTDEDSENEGAA